MTKERKKILFIFILMNSLILISTLVFCAVFKPIEIIESGVKSDCVFQKLFNRYCPGCGGTRSLGFLLSFDILNSFIYYPPILAGSFLIAFINVLLIISFKRDTLSLIEKRKYFEFLLIPITIILTFLIRNLLLRFGIDYIGDII